MIAPVGISTRITDSFEFLANHRRQLLQSFAEPVRNHQGVVAFRQIAICAKFSECSIIVDRKIVDDRIHRKRHGCFHTAFDRHHHALEPVLSFFAHRRIEDKTHAAAGHAAQHPESLELIAVLRPTFLNQAFRVRIAAPGNNGLQRLVKVAMRGRSDSGNIAGFQ